MLIEELGKIQNDTELNGLINEINSIREQHRLYIQEKTQEIEKANNTLDEFEKRYNDLLQEYFQTVHLEQKGRKKLYSTSENDIEIIKQNPTYKRNESKLLEELKKYKLDKFINQTIVEKPSWKDLKLHTNIKDGKVYVGKDELTAVTLEDGGEKIVVTPRKVE